MYANELQKESKYEYTHCEIHPSMMFGVMGHQVILPEHNQLPRNLFGCGQAKQAASLYHSNFPYRIDKMGVLLNYGEKPLVKNRIFKYIHEEQHPYGFNAIVAIMCYNAYNVEDAILINEGAVKRGLYNTTYYNMYETNEENGSNNQTGKNVVIKDIKNETGISVKPGYDYNYLDENGIIKENTEMNDKKMLIGMVSYNDDDVTQRSDASIYPKKGQLGYVDKVYVSDELEGKRIAKIRIREQRIPAVGDKFCSRCGQKGTIGKLVPEEDMPFTKDGRKPDIIINPHAIPSRMTIGQLVETIMGKLGLELGCAMDATPFTTESNKIQKIGDYLTKYGMHSSGNEYLYNGMTGEQIEYSIFMGPTYYMRLKHMVKDKINHRANGPRTLLTRQTNHGRANDGGLRIGEMERDGMIAHGCAHFLKDSMMTRGDKYRMVICNQSGTIAIHDKVSNNLYSPILDGPIISNIEGKHNITTTKISKYGKKFSVVEVPYSLKLLIQELSAMNVQMRIITEDNIDNILTTPSKYKLENTTGPLEEINPIKNINNGNNNNNNVSFENTNTSNIIKVNGKDRILKPNYLDLWNQMEQDDETIYYSIILNENKEPSEYFFESDLKILLGEGNPPNFYPLGWDHKIVKDYGFNEQTIVGLLKRNNDIPNNFNKIIQKMIERQRSGLSYNNIDKLSNEVITKPVLPEYEYESPENETTESNSPQFNMSTLPEPVPEQQQEQEQEPVPEAESEPEPEPEQEQEQEQEPEPEAEPEAESEPENESEPINTTKGGNASEIIVVKKV